MTTKQASRTAAAVERKPHPDCEAKIRRHGTYSAARYGCTCPDAIADRRRYAKLHHHGYAQPRRVDAVGTRRRLQALCALGWARQALADRLGVTARAVNYFLKAERVNASTALRVREVYDELWLTPGTSARARADAQRAGWASPLAWDDDEIDDPDASPRLGAAGTVVDEVAIHRAVSGHRGDARLDRVERIEAIRQCIASGMPAWDIAARVGVSTRTVDRVAAARASSPTTNVA